MKTGFMSSGNALPPQPPAPILTGWPRVTDRNGDPDGETDGAKIFDSSGGRKRLIVSMALERLGDSLNVCEVGVNEREG